MKEEKVESETGEESDSKKDSRSQFPENGKKKKLISINLTSSADEGVADSKKSKNKRDDSCTEKDLSACVPNPSKMEKDHKSKIRRGRNSGSLNASDLNCELDHSSAAECDKIRKKIKHEASESETANQSVQKIKTLSEEEMCNNLKKRKISDSTAGANDTGKTSRSVNMELKKEKEFDSESMQEAPSDNVKVQNEKKKKRERNLKEETRKEDLDDSETGIEIMGKRELKQSRNKYLEMQRSNVTIINADKEESSEVYVVKEEKSAEFSFTSGVAMNNETESPCSDPENVKSSCFMTGCDNVIINHNRSHNLPAKIGQSRSHLPHRLIGLMYQLDLSILCLLRKYKFQQKYPTLSLGFGDSKIDQFNNIVLRYKEKSIHIQIENVEKRHIEDNISYDRLFTKVNRSFFINAYFNSFVQHQISEAETLKNSIEYLIVYTNSGLDLTEEMRLKQMRSKNFYPFKFESIMNCDILNDFLITNDDTKKEGFYKFSRDTATREEFFKRLQFSSAMQKVITRRQLPQGYEKDVKEDFFDKLVFAVNQPKRQELNSIIKNEVDKSSKCQYDYTALREEVLRDLTGVEKHKQLGKSVNYIPGIIYEFNLLMFFLHDMFLHKHMLSINFEEKSNEISNDITINYRGRITCVKAHTADGKIGFSQLFPLQKTKEKNTFSINKHFSLFVEDFEKDIRYFIIYTNADLDLTEENKLKQGRSNDFYPLKFCSVDIQKKKFKILRNCSCINENGLYQFAQEETREKLLCLLKLPASLQKEKEERRLSDENENEIKEKFLNKLIFAVNQPNTTGLDSVIRERITNDNEFNNVPHNYEELHEIALRWYESHEVGPITQRVMKEIFEDIKNNRISNQKILNKNINEEIRFAKIVVGSEESLAFGQFLDFLIKEERLETLKRKGVNLLSMANILRKSGSHAKKAFKSLYDLWFDVEGNKTRYLTILEEKGISLATMSSILVSSRADCAEAFKDLYDLWFDIEGNETKYLKTVEEKRMKLASLTCILNKAGANAAEAFKDLYDIWFDVEGNKTQYLKTLEEEGLNLSNISSMLSGARSNAAEAFKDLYNLWFDEERNKTQYLKTLEENGINLPSISNMLAGAGSNAAEAFKELYKLLFDGERNKTQYLKTLEEAGINLSNLSGVLGRAGTKAAKVFKELYNLLFDKEGNKTQYLETLEKKGLTLSNFFAILNKAGAKAPKAFIDLYNIWFDVEGNKGQYLKAIEEKGIKLTTMCSILRAAGANAAKAFKELYDTFFDIQGNETKYLKTLEEQGINLNNMFTILQGSGANAVKSFKSLYNLLFDLNGNKTQYLTNLEEKGMRLTNMSSILCGTGANATKAFKDLYDLWFDVEGNETKYLKTLEEKDVNLTKLSSILNKSRANAAKAFKDLHSLWFDEQGNATPYLKTLEEKEIKLTNVASILTGAGTNAAKGFKDLYDLWFDIEGNKTQYLKALEKKAINLISMSSILHKAGANAAKAFKDLYDLWFDVEGNETQYLKVLEEKGVNLTNMSSILSGSGASAGKAFKDLYNTFFDTQGNNSRHLKHFIEEEDEEKCFKLRNLSVILSGSGATAKGAFEKLHSVCFNEEGKRTKLLDDFYNAGFMACDLCSILSAAASSFKKFHDFCFIGESKKYLKHLLNETEGFTPKNLSKIFRGAGTNICSALKDFHDLVFDETGNKTQLLVDIYKAGFKPTDLSNILSSAGNNAASILDNFYQTCFNKKN